MNSMKLVVLLHLIVLVNSHQRWKQTRSGVCFHLWCELTLTLWCPSIVWSLFSEIKCNGMTSFMEFMKCVLQCSLNLHNFLSHRKVVMKRLLERTKKNCWKRTRSQRRRMMTTRRQWLITTTLPTANKNRSLNRLASWSMASSRSIRWVHLVTCLSWQALQNGSIFTIVNMSNGTSFLTCVLRKRSK